MTMTEATLEPTAAEPLAVFDAEQAYVTGVRSDFNASELPKELFAAAQQRVRQRDVKHVGRAFGVDPGKGRLFTLTGGPLKVFRITQDLLDRTRAPFQ